jgi:hypothetical protein
MSTRRRSFTGTQQPSDWLRPHRERFLKGLADQGYAGATLRTYRNAASVFCQEVLRRKVSEGQLVGRALAEARAAALDAMHTGKRVYKRFCLDRFIDALAGPVLPRERNRLTVHRPRLTSCVRSTRPI